MYYQCVVCCICFFYKYVFKLKKKKKHCTNPVKGNKILTNRSVRAIFPYIYFTQFNFIESG